MNRQETIKAYLALAAVCFFWGTTYLAIRIGVEVMPPALFAGIRFFVAGLIFIPILRVFGHAMPSKNDWRIIIMISIALLVVANGIVVWAEQWVPSGLAALIVSTLPFWMVGIEAMLPRGESLSLQKITGLVIGFSGLLILLWPDLHSAINREYLVGIGAIAFAAISWAAGSVYSKHRKVSAKPLMSSAFQMLIAGTILIFIGIINDELSKLTFTSQGVLSLVYLIIFGSIVGYGSFVYALNKLPSSIVSMYAFINPIVAVILGWLILDERLDWRVAIATAIILFGVVVVKKSSTHKTVEQISTKKHLFIGVVEDDVV
ncbi:EamA family transporter [candidate division KSB1 bacterium]|nr:EamA family transporter [candidate division KSB1 bacterium]